MHGYRYSEDAVAIDGQYTDNKDKGGQQRQRDGELDGKATTEDQDDKTWSTFSRLKCRQVVWAPGDGQWFRVFGEAILKCAIFNDGILSSLAVKHFLALHLDLVRGLATWYRLSIAVKNGNLLGFPTTATCGLAEDTAASEGICIKFTV